VLRKVFLADTSIDRKYTIVSLPFLSEIRSGAGMQHAHQLQPAYFFRIHLEDVTLVS